MKREIKFRAWDKKNKEWLTLSELSKKLGDWFVYNPEVPEAIGVELMQFTGLKDKNGKEIYEGDIVKHDDGNDVIETSTIRWTHSYKPGFEFPCQTAEHLEVIGNIYENPELLSAPEEGK